jgi:hypothetical protein
VIRQRVCSIPVHQAAGHENRKIGDHDGRGLASKATGFGTDSARGEKAVVKFAQRILFIDENYFLCRTDFPQLNGIKFSYSKSPSWKN